MPGRPPKKKESNTIDVHVGRRIRMRRVWNGMSQGTLAGAIGVTFQQVQKYEKGTNRVSASRLQEIAAVLSVTPSYFFEDVPDRESAAGMPPAEKALADFLSSAEGLASIGHSRALKIRRFVGALSAWSKVSLPNLRVLRRRKLEPVHCTDLQRD